MTTDAFPPLCGGSGWSTFHLARALVRAGFEVRIVKPQAGLAGVRSRRYEGLDVDELGYTLYDVPYVRSVLRDGVLARRLRSFLREAIGAWRPDVVHAQHVTSAAPSIAAARTAGVPAVVTVRDYWPVCYFTTLHVDHETCPDCSLPKMLRCMKEKSPRAYWAGAPMIPYMRQNVRRKQAALRDASAVVAVSRYVADVAVRPIVGDAATRVIPNLVDLDEVRRVAAAAPASALPERFLAFVGKINAFKGARLALDAVARLRHRIPLVMVGQGDDRALVERRAREQDLDVRFLPWVENDEVLRILRRAALLLVPSVWPEPLSRTVIEAMAVGTPVAATGRGGISDQIEHGVSGLILPTDPAAFAAAVDAFLDDTTAAARYAEAAADRVRERFAAPVVLAQIVSLYEEVVARSRAA